MEVKVEFLGCSCMADVPPGWSAIWTAALQPYFEVGRGRGRDPVLSIVARRSSQPAAADDQSGRPVRLHMDHIGFRRDDDVGVTVIRSAGLGAVYRLAKREGRAELRVDYRALDSASALDALRIVRGVLVRQAESAGYRRCHMAVLDVDGAGIGFVGPPGSGKTSFLLAMLARRRQWSFVTNDKALADRDGPGVIGLPYAITIGLDTLKHVQDVQLTADDRLQGGEALMWPGSLTERLGNRIAVRSRLAAVVRVMISFASDDTPRIERVSHESDLARSIVDEMADAEDRVSPSWLYPMLKMTPKCAMPSEGAVSIPIYLARGNPFALRMSAMLDQFIEGVGDGRPTA